ncbi:MAG TPA: ATP-dependent zinc metalloprotease FtsH [Opitutales bacterium]|nr:ATP-dependent zinc metalloprotease FtsH [Opitutales bacterium]
MSDSPNPRSNKPLRDNSSDRFQPKVLLIWFIIFTLILSLWSFYPNEATGPREWNVAQTIEATARGNILYGTMESDPSGGNDWYVLRGKAKVMMPAAEAKKFLAKKGELQSEEPAAETVVNPAALAHASPTDLVPVEVNFRAEGRLTESDFRILQSSGVFQEKRASTILTELILSIVPFVLIIGLLYFLFMRQIKMAGRGAMSFGKSRARMLTREKERVLFDDVAGCDEAKEEVQEIVEFLKDPKKFTKIGGRVPKGVLMVGPPGTGKTLLARAVAGEADVPFFSISGSDFVEMFVGVGAARVRDMFEQGRKNAPCIIFIDEIDAVGRQRGAGLGGGNDEREQTLNSLLVEMDGFDGHEGVIIIAATNRPDVLDNALLRPGRFDRQITIDLPDIFGREDILKVHAKKVKLGAGVDLSIVARNTPGFSGADLANLLNEGALIAARFNKEQIDMQDVDEAREKIAFGRERRRLMDDEDKKITAYHEAGHALVQAVIDDGHLPVHKVTIIPRGASLGSTMFIPKKDILNHAKRRLENQVCCAMGGRVAEEIVMGDITSGASGDIKAATKIARHMVCDWGMSSLGPVAYGENQDHIFLGKEITRTQNYSELTAEKIDEAITSIVETQYQRAKEIVQSRRDALEKMAQALLEFETIEGKHVHEILEFGEMRSPVVRMRVKPKKDNDSTSSNAREKSSEATLDTGSPSHVPA